MPVLVRSSDHTMTNMTSAERVLITYTSSALYIFASSGCAFFQSRALMMLYILESHQVSARGPCLFL